MPKLPKYPKGLKASINKLERKAKQKQAIVARKREIESMKKKRDALRKKL
jgi:hypothetical protein